MDKLIGTFKGVFTTAANAGGDLAKTASFALENVNWADELKEPEALSNPIVDRYLEAVCINSGDANSSTRRVAEALLSVTGQIAWRKRDSGGENDADLAVFTKRYTSCCIIGEGGLLSSDKVSAGFSLQGPDAYYPPHAHVAEESYWIIGGGGDWKVDQRSWFPVKSGDAVYHNSGARHAMQTNEQPMLSIWLWTSHLDSEVVIVRD